MIRLYGHLQGSFRTVTQGLKLAFEELEVLDGYHIGEELDFDSDPVGGAASPIAVVVGDPLRALMAHTQGEHKEIWLMLAPNSEGVPPKLVRELTAKRGNRKTIDGLLAPSEWAQGVLQRSFPDLPVELCQHGVLPCFKMDRVLRRDIFSRETFSALHITSTNHSRKGTLQLVDAWVEAVQSRILNDVKLSIACNPVYFNEIEGYLHKTSAKAFGVEVINGQSLEFSALAHFFHLVDYVIQPSRAEGFGLVPLEARACGVPVVMTDCTGHGDHFEEIDGVVRVLNREVSGSDDYWGASAPVVCKEDIVLALEEAFKEWPKHFWSAIEDADRVRNQWTWTKGAAGVVVKWKGKYV